MDEQLQQQRKIQTELHVGGQTVQFEHQLLDTRNLGQEITAAHQSLEQFQAARAQILHEALPVVQVQAQAQPQVQAPQPAPAELTYKERKEKEKQRKAAVKEGRQYAPHADEETVRLIRSKEAAPDPAIRDDYTPQQLEKEVQSICNIRITADMFTRENFAANYGMLQNALYKFEHIAQLAETYPEYIAQLPRTDMMRHRALQRCMDMALPLKQLLTVASAAHGLTLEGTGIAEENIVLFAREQMDGRLDAFRQILADMEQRRQDDLNEVLDREHTAEAETYETVTKPDFQRAYLEDNPDQAWMQAPTFSYFSYYEETQAMKELIESRGEAYLQNKALIDRMYSDMIRQLELAGELKAQSSAWQNVQTKYQPYFGHPKGGDGDVLCRRATARVDRLAVQNQAVIEKFEAIKDAAKVLLKGSRLNPLNAAVLQSYGYTGAERLAAQAKADACACATRDRWQKAALRKLMDSGDFQTDHPEDEYVSRAVTLFRQGDDAYNLQVLTLLQQHKSFLAEKPPVQAEGMSAEVFQLEKNRFTEHHWRVYDNTRQLVLPVVQRTMAWDMDAALRMDDTQLIAKQKELDTLFGDNMFVSDLMKIKHPQKEMLMMKDELLGDKLDEFSYRVTMIRTLAEKSRGLAIKFAAKLGPLTEEFFTEPELRNKLHGDPAANGLSFVESRIEMADRYRTTTQARREDERDIHSKAFKDKCVELQKKKPIFNNLIQLPTQFDEINNYYEQRYAFSYEDRFKALSQEDQAIIERMRNAQYSLACWDKEDAEAYVREHHLEGDKDALSLTIGEPLFRVFTSYCPAAGVQTMTPEEYHKMLKDLSAGYGMKKGVTPPEEIQAAREQNLRGCREFKESLRVHYDYLARKYGYGLENLTMLEFYDHYEEILRDFSNIQVDVDFVLRMPHVIDRNNPEDMMIYNQINYMSMTSFQIQQMLTYFVLMNRTPEDIHAELQGNLENPAIKPYREALKAAGAGSGMTDRIKWDTKVGQRRRPIE